MIEHCTLTQLRDNLGRFAQSAALGDARFAILRNGREVGGLVSARDLAMLDNAMSRTMEYKAVQVAEELMRWRLIREGLEDRMRS
jgi:hypothetical protein